MNVTDKLKGLGYEPIPEEFYNKVSDWKSWYQGDVKGFHRYKVRNGHDIVSCKRYSLQMAKKVAEDWANLLMNERVKITIDGDSEQQFIDDVFKRNNFYIKCNEMQEMKSAVGTVAYVPRVIGQVENGNARAVAIDYVTAENIRPLSWENGNINECAFCSNIFVDGKNYLYMQIHVVNESGFYDIHNHIFEIINESLADRNLTEVKGYENIPPVVHTGSDKRQFVIDRPNISNNYDYDLPMGIPVYANACDVLKGIDVAYDSYVNEFVLGKKRIVVNPAASKFLDGEPVFDSAEMVYYVLPEEVNDSTIIHEIDMSLRTAEHNTGLQDQLNLLSSKCGFGENYYRFNQGSIATATQIISENSTLFRTIKKHEIILDSVIKELCEILIRLGNTALGNHLNEEAEITIDFDDSIIEDKQTEFARDFQMLQAGIMNAWEFRMKHMNEDEATAKKMLPKMEELTTEGQEEVE